MISSLFLRCWLKVKVKCVIKCLLTVYKSYIMYMCTELFLGLLKTTEKYIMTRYCVIKDP